MAKVKLAIMILVLATMSTTVVYYSFSYLSKPYMAWLSGDGK